MLSTLKMFLWSYINTFACSFLSVRNTYKISGNFVTSAGNIILYFTVVYYLILLSNTKANLDSVPQSTVSASHLYVKRRIE